MEHRHGVPARRTARNRVRLVRPGAGTDRCGLERRRRHARPGQARVVERGTAGLGERCAPASAGRGPAAAVRPVDAACRQPAVRSEEHTSELQSLMRISYAVFCLKKKNTKYSTHNQANEHEET